MTARYRKRRSRALHRIRQADRVLFVIVNKQDTVSPSERGQVLEFVKERLAQYFFSREPLVFSVSARQALEGKQSRNDELVESSGIRQVEEALFQFLTEEKAEAFLSSIQARVLAFLTQRSDLERLAKPERREILAGLLARLHERTAPTRRKSAQKSPRIKAKRAGVTSA